MQQEKPSTLQILDVGSYPEARGALAQRIGGVWVTQRRAEQLDVLSVSWHHGPTPKPWHWVSLLALTSPNASHMSGLTPGSRFEFCPHGFGFQPTSTEHSPRTHRWAQPDQVCTLGTCHPEMQTVVHHFPICVTHPAKHHAVPGSTAVASSPCSPPSPWRMLWISPESLSHKYSDA